MTSLRPPYVPHSLLYLALATGAAAQAVVKPGTVQQAPSLLGWSDTLSSHVQRNGDAPGAWISSSANGNELAWSGGSHYPDAGSVNSTETISSLAAAFARGGANPFAITTPAANAARVDPSSAASSLPTGEWAWESGGSSLDFECGGGGPTSAGLPGVYGTLGAPAAGNTPGSRGGVVQWTGTGGNLWMFGGSGFDGGGGCGELNDMWRFDPSTHEWTWMAGSNSVTYLAGVYGKLGKSSPTSQPGGRDLGVSWTDGNGNLWMFGGFGLDGGANNEELNDLWVFKPSTHEWAWMAGSKVGNGVGVYGTKGQGGPKNTPGSRDGAMGWVDCDGNLWLFGGNGYGTDATNSGFLNDLWKFNPSTTEWTWIGGSSDVGVSGVYGSLGVGSTANGPGGRYGGTTWADSKGHLWLLGGEGYPSGSPAAAILNDLWEFAPSTREWTWKGGSNVKGPYFAPVGFGQIGVYGKLGVPQAGNIPGSRFQASTWTDTKGNVWLFGGDGFDSVGTADLLNDLWEYSPSSKLWAWMGGNNTIPEGTLNKGIYGTIRVPSKVNVPGPRRTAASWTDLSGHFWLFGGDGRDGSGRLGKLNDLWEYRANAGAETPSTTP